MNEDIEVGTHLITQRHVNGLPIYTHHGVYVGEGRVVHYAGNSNDPMADGEKIQIVSLERFCDGQALWMAAHPNSRFTANEIVMRAHGRLGEDGYSLFANNCEHFCNWVIDDCHNSRQIDVGTVAAAPIGGGALGLAGAAGITAIGTAAELAGGAAMMKGMAAVGVIGGAVGGVAISGLLAGGAAAIALNKTILAHVEGQSEPEQDARAIGRSASVAGAAGGAAATVGLISAVGVPGLSAAGITSGLAGMGGALGGGMATGIAVGIALPAVAAVGTAMLAYKVAQNNETVRDALTKASDVAGDLASKGADTARDAASVAAPIVRDAAVVAVGVAKGGIRSMLAVVEGGAAALRKKIDGGSDAI